MKLFLTYQCAANLTRFPGRMSGHYDSPNYLRAQYFLLTVNDYCDFGQHYFALSEPGLTSSRSLQAGNISAGEPTGTGWVGRKCCHGEFPDPTYGDKIWPGLPSQASTTNISAFGMGDENLAVRYRFVLATIHEPPALFSRLQNSFAPARSGWPMRISKRGALPKLGLITRRTMGV